jgi:four helix bundle protein
MNGDKSRRGHGLEDLKVFRKAYAISLELHRASLDFPRIEQFALADQVRRASKSVCANLAEGFGRQSHSRADFCRFVVMAMGSADEMGVWLSYCIDLGYVDAALGARWKDEYLDIARMLAGLSSKIGSSVRDPSDL